MSVKTLRFGPLPSSSNPDGTTPERHLWDKFIDIPADTRLRIVTLPGGQEVYDGLATRSHSRDYDPGKYQYVMMIQIAAAGDGTPAQFLRAEGDFLVDLTEPEWSRLKSAAPKFAEGPMQTTEGQVWKCKRCGRKTGTRVAAYLHESKDHFGIDPIAEPHRQIEVDTQGLGVAEKLRQESRAAGSVPESDILRQMSANRP